MITKKEDKEFIPKYVKHTLEEIAIESYETLKEPIKRAADTAKDYTIKCGKIMGLAAIGLVELCKGTILGSFIPSKLREKYYDQVDKLYMRLGIYKNEEEYKNMIGLRNIAAGIPEFITFIGILPALDLVIRMHVLDEYYEGSSYFKHTSKKYMPAMMPIELAYVYSMKSASAIAKGARTLKRGFNYIKNKLKKNKAASEEERDYC